MSRQNNIRMIFVAARQLGLDEETRRDLQLVATGKTSLTDMSDPEVAKVLTALKTKGFKSGRAGGKGARPPPEVTSVSPMSCGANWLPPMPSRPGGRRG